MCKLLKKEMKFEFDGNCVRVLNYLKEKLVSSSIIVSPNCTSPFKLMGDASGLALGSVLGQIKDKLSYPIYYASINDA